MMSAPEDFDLDGYDLDDFNGDEGELEGPPLAELRLLRFQRALFNAQRELTEFISKHPDREAIKRAVDEDMQRSLATRH